MAMFIFSLTPSTGDAETWMIFDALHRRFPSHTFNPVTAGESDLENSIVPIFDIEKNGEQVAAPSGLTRDLVQEIEIVFQELVSGARGWKPS